LSSEHVERRLAAILAADVAGSCRLIGIDEEGTLAQLKALRRTLFDPKITDHRGRIVKNTGDGALVEFGSVVDAVRCAVEIQRGMAEHNIDVPEVKRIEFRIGIHVGDIIIEDHDIFGDGVNIAARLEGIAEPGGVCMSDDAYRQVRGKVEIACDDMGQQSLKNIADPMQAWRVRLNGQTPSAVNSGSAVSQPRVLPSPDKPSIAVLPFQNMSGDPEQEYFADGMVEDIIAALSRFKSLFVIARNSSFTYKGKAVDIKQVGRELGVRYVLEGSVRKAGSRVRITGQLIDATTGAHLWADKFEGELQDVFDLQDKVATSVVGAIAPRLLDAEAELVKRKPPESWASYDFYLRGRSLYRQRTLDTTEQALDLFRKAIDLDQEFGRAHALAAGCIFNRPQFGGRPVTDEERSEAVQLAARALALAGDDEFVLAWAAIIFTYWNDELERGSDLVDRALAINLNWSGGWTARGWISVALSDGARALDAFDRAIRLNPADDFEVLNAMQGKISAFFLLERNSDALEMIDRVLARRPNDLRAWFFKYARDPDSARAADAADHIRALYPHLRSSNLRSLFILASRSINPKSRAFMENAIAGLGLPE
jgi:TolB-like protein/class 3 adenylate cyclase/tetratricopeptide (TPR) repeat protein